MILIVASKKFGKGKTTLRPISLMSFIDKKTEQEHARKTIIIEVNNNAVFFPEENIDLAACLVRIKERVVSTTKPIIDNTNLTIGFFP